MRRAVLRTLADPFSGDVIDTALVTRFEAPASFSGEDLAEIGLTGGRAVVAAMARALTRMPGMRPAEPGEFAFRAYINGKLDLSAVEGLADLVDAETEAQRKQAQRIAGGSLRRECEAIRAALLSAMATIEACLDFSDEEDAASLSITIAMSAVADVRDRLELGLGTAGKARRLREGFVVTIAGPPNAGKSTLINVLTGRDVAITSALPGTTRDAIEVHLDLGGYPVLLIDTAGIRDSDDLIERLGIERARERAKAADLVLWLQEDEATPPILEAACPIWTVRTKCDAGVETSPVDPRVQYISAKSGYGVSYLLSKIGDLAEESMSSGVLPILALERHERAFRTAHSALVLALEHPVGELELVAENLRVAASCVDQVVGRIGVEDVLGEIFSRLCIGK